MLHRPLTLTVISLLVCSAAAGATTTAYAGPDHAGARVVVSGAAPGFTGAIEQVAGVPHDSDVWAVAEDERTGSHPPESVLRRHHGKWQRVKHFNGDVGTVAAAGKKAIWIGGYRQSSYTLPVIEHWTGKKFATQHVPATSGDIIDIAASSTSNAWAVGSIATATNEVAEHWNGHKWSAVPIPVSQLTKVTTSGAKNAWALDTQQDENQVLRWNGTAWAVSLAAPAGVTFSDVATTSAHDAVAVGVRASGARQHTFVERFDGKAWHHVSTPNVLHSAGLFSVSAHGSAFWAVGGGTTSKGGFGTLILHSTGGKKWKKQKSPIGGDTTFASVSAVSTKRAFIGGDHRPSSDDYPTTTFAAYDGHHWKAERSTV